MRITPLPDRPPCTHDPDRWFYPHPDDHEAVQMCRSCPIRAACAKTAWEHGSGVSGLIAGFVVPENSTDRSYDQAMRHLYSIAALGGHTPEDEAREERRRGRRIKVAG